MSEQPTSLLSLPDELLVRIFDYLEVQLRYRDHPLLPSMSVCRRLRQVVPTVLYRDVVLSPYASASSHVRTAIEGNPSLGQLIDRLELCDTGSVQVSHENRVIAFEQTQAMIRVLSHLKELTLLDMTTDEANAVLAGLPSPSLRTLELQLHWTTNLQHRQDLWAQLSRHPELCVLECSGRSSPLDDRPRIAALPAQHLSLPKLNELHVTDGSLIQTFGTAASSLPEALPSLQTVHITITQPELMPAVSTILSHSPPSLVDLKVTLNCFGGEDPRGYFAALPPLRHLEFGPRTFREDDLLAYLPTSTLESISFKYKVEVTDRMLEALTGPRRPPPLRQISLDHMASPRPDEIAQYLECCEFNYCDPRLLHDLAEELRNEIGPCWASEGTGEGTKEGLRRALADADANGIKVTGRAAGCLDFTYTVNIALAEYMLEQRDKTEDVNTKFAPAVLTWLEEYESDKADLLRADTNALELGDTAT